MKIIVLTTDDYRSHIILSRIIRVHHKSILGIFVESPSAQGFSPFKTLWRIAKRSGLRCALYYAVEAVTYSAIMAMKRFFGINRVENFFDAAAIAEVPVERIHSANSREFLETLRFWRPDLLALVRYNRIIGKELTRIPRLATLNLHTGLLPNYRGLASTLNAMVRNEKVAGATIHVVNNEIDGGDVVGQVTALIDYRESALVNQFRIMENGALLFRRGLRSILDHGEVVGELQPSGGQYFGWPPKEEIRRFLNRGGKLFRLRDISFLWRNL